MASDSKPGKFFEPPPPEVPPEVTFRGSKCFSTTISVQKHLHIAIKHLQRSHQLITETVAPLNRPTPDFYTAIWPFR